MCKVKNLSKQMFSNISFKIDWVLILPVTHAQLFQTLFELKHSPKLLNLLGRFGIERSSPKVEHDSRNSVFGMELVGPLELFSGARTRPLGWSSESSPHRAYKDIEPCELPINHV